MVVVGIVADIGLVDIAMRVVVPSVAPAVAVKVAVVETHLAAEPVAVIFFLASVLVAVVAPPVAVAVKLLGVVHFLRKLFVCTYPIVVVMSELDLKSLPIGPDRDGATIH